MATPFMLSKDNIELQFATNHLGMLLIYAKIEVWEKTKFLCMICNSLWWCVYDFCFSFFCVFLHSAGHFLLTNLLLDTMKKTAKKSRKEGRIVNVSSIAHRFIYREGIRFDKINDQSG